MRFLCTIMAKRTFKQAWKDCCGFIRKPFPIATPVPTPPPLVRKLKGLNMANATNFAGATDFQPVLNSMGVDVQRHPGGTAALSYHPTTESLEIMADMAIAAGSAVLWVQNMTNGTVDEMLLTMRYFKSRGVNVVGMEADNEGYLRQHQTTFPTAYVYLEKAKIFIDALKVEFPDIPVGIVVAPSTAMKDPDSSEGGTGIQRLIDWNNIVLASKLGDASIIHCYTAPADIAAFVPAAVAHVQAVITARDKPVWLTEYNISLDNVYTGAQTPTQYNFIQGMIAAMTAIASVQFMVLHNCAASGARNNTITITGDGHGGSTAALNGLGTAYQAM